MLGAALEAVLHLYATGPHAWARCKGESCLRHTITPLIHGRPLIILSEWHVAPTDILGFLPRTSLFTDLCQTSHSNGIAMLKHNQQSYTKLDWICGNDPVQ